MNVKIRNEIQALIRIQERNNNGGELREFICARKVDDCGEKTYLIERGFMGVRHGPGIHLRIRP